MGYRICWAKNIDSSANTYFGKELAVNETYQIPDAYRLGWANNDTVIADIASDKLQIGYDGTNWYSAYADQVAHLQDTVIATTDGDGSALIRPKITKTGWKYQANFFNFETSKLSSLANTDFDGGSIAVSMKFYDNTDTELTTQASIDSSCTYCLVDFEPTHDYELIAGNLFSSAVPTSDTYIHVRAIPDLSVANGGSIDFIKNMNVKYLGVGYFKFDGRAGKLLPYDATYHTNKMRIKVTHPAGFQHKLGVLIELYKE